MDRDDPTELDRIDRRLRRLDDGVVPAVVADEDGDLDGIGFPDQHRRRRHVRDRFFDLHRDTPPNAGEAMLDVKPVRRGDDHPMRLVGRQAVIGRTIPAATMALGQTIGAGDGNLRFFTRVRGLHQATAA